MSIELLNEDQGTVTLLLAYDHEGLVEHTVTVSDPEELVSSVQACQGVGVKEEPQRFVPRKGSVYHTGDFKTAVSRACKELYPRNQDETNDQWYARMDQTEFWKLGNELNECLMHGRDGDLRDRMAVVQAVIDNYGEDQPPGKEERFTMMLCQTFCHRAQVILDQRQADRMKRRHREVEGMFQLAARVHNKK